MTTKCDVKGMLEQFHSKDKDCTEENVDNIPLEFICQYNLLCGFKMEISAMERKKLMKWKEMAINTENKLETQRNEKNKNILEEVHKVALQLEKNRLQRMNEKKDSLGVNNGTFIVKSECQEETPPCTMNTSGNKVGVTGTLENHVRRDDKGISISRQLMESNINGMDNVPALKKHMECLQALQSRQKELDEWYTVMQKQLDLEKVRLTAKYEEMHLKNIREQQSIIDSSQEFLRCASNNNTPNYNTNNNTPNYNMNYKQTVNEKNQSTPLSTSRGSPLVQTSSPISTNKQQSSENAKPNNGNEIKSIDDERIVTEEKISPINEIECASSNKNSLEFSTPLSTPDKEINIKTVLLDIAAKEREKVNTTHLSMKRSNNSLRFSSNNTHETEKPGSVSVNYSPSSNKRYTCTDSTTEMCRNENTTSSLVNGVNDFPEMNLVRSNSCSKSSLRTMSSLEGDKRETKNNSLLKESSQFSPTKVSVEIPDDLKPVISVPPRRNSKSDVADSLEIGNNSLEDLMKKPFNELKARRKSRPIKFFNDPFPPKELLSSHEFDDDTSRSNGHVTVHSPVGVQLNKSQHQQKNHTSSSSSAKPVTPSFASSNVSSGQPEQRNKSHRDHSPEKDTSAIDPSDIQESVSGKSYSVPPPLDERSCNNWVGAKETAEPMVTPSKGINTSATTTTNFQRDCYTSTPHQAKVKGEERFLLEISAVTSQQNNDATPKTTISRYPVPKGAAKLYAVIKGFLTRRLFNTIKVQEIIKTIKDTEEFLIDINKENIFSQKLADKQLKIRLQDELSTKHGKLHDIFFNMDACDQMKMLAISRAQVEERNRKKQAQMKASRPNPVRTVGSSVSSKVSSTVSQKSTRKKPGQTNSINEKAFKSKPVQVKAVPEKMNNNMKKGKNTMESNNVPNMYVCIAGALKPIQSCTSPTMVDRKKGRSPAKTSVQNRYTKKSSASKRLDMNAAVGTTR